MRPLHILAAGLSLSAATLLPALAGISDLKGPDGSARGTVTVSAPYAHVLCHTVAHTYTVTVRARYDTVTVRTRYTRPCEESTTDV